jgi:hypothetical protein
MWPCWNILQIPSHYLVVWARMFLVGFFNMQLVQNVTLSTSLLWPPHAFQSLFNLWGYMTILQGFSHRFLTPFIVSQYPCIATPYMWSTHHFHALLPIKAWHGHTWQAVLWPWMLSHLDSCCHLSFMTTLRCCLPITESLWKRDVHHWLWGDTFINVEGCKRMEDHDILHWLHQ